MINKITNSCVKTVCLLLVFLSIAGFTAGSMSAAGTKPSEPDLTVEAYDCATVSIRASQIINQLADNAEATRLLDYLTFIITHEGEELFRGKYNAIPTPVIDYITLKTGESYKIDVEIDFDIDTPNELQGQPLDLKWKFDSMGERGASLRMNKDNFYHNANINPGDKLYFRILLKNSGSKSDTDPPEPVHSNPDIILTGDGANAAAKIISSIVFILTALLLIGALILLFKSFYKKRKDEE